MRILVTIILALSAAACGGVGYKDTNAAVDANPLCIDGPNRPGEPVSKDCERTQEATWSSEDKGSREPIDFSGKKD
jgi:hypothetical protein